MTKKSLERNLREQAEAKLQLAVAQLKDIIKNESTSATGQKSALQVDCESTLEKIEELSVPQLDESIDLCPGCGQVNVGYLYCSISCYFKSAAKDRDED